MHTNCRHRKEIERYLPLIEVTEKLCQQFVRGLYPKEGRDETLIIHRYVVSLIEDDISSKLKPIRARLFSELLNEAAKRGIKYLFLANHRRFYITSHDLISNPTEYNYENGLWNLSRELLGHSCGNGSQAQITFISNPKRLTTLELIYGPERCGFAYDVKTGEAITNISEIERVLKIKFR